MPGVFRFTFPIASELTGIGWICDIDVLLYLDVFILCVCVCVYSVYILYIYYFEIFDYYCGIIRYLFSIYCVMNNLTDTDKKTIIDNWIKKIEDAFEFHNCDKNEIIDGFRQIAFENNHPTSRFKKKFFETFEGSIDVIMVEYMITLLDDSYQEFLRTNRKSKILSIKDLNTSSVLEVSNIVDAECSICLDNIAVGSIVRIFNKCKHNFHYICSDKWLETSSSCPNCRTCFV